MSITLDVFSIPDSLITFNLSPILKIWSFVVIRPYVLSEVSSLVKDATSYEVAKLNNQLFETASIWLTPRVLISAVSPFA